MLAHARAHRSVLPHIWPPIRRCLLRALTSVFRDFALGGVLLWSVPLLRNSF
jgi:hypothetical protein